MSQHFSLINRFASADIVHAGVIASIITLAACNPVENTHALVRRTPSDESGKCIMSLECDSETIPQPGGAEGEGEGGFSQFSNTTMFQDSDGKQYPPSSCTNDGKDGFCNLCTWSGDNKGTLKDDVTVTACFDAMGGTGGCSIEFNYGGYDYNSQTKEPKCGHSNKGLQAFSSSLQALCYFDA